MAKWLLFFVCYLLLSKSSERFIFPSFLALLYWMQTQLAEKSVCELWIQSCYVLLHNIIMCLFIRYYRMQMGEKWLYTGFVEKASINFELISEFCLICIVYLHVKLLLFVIIILCTWWSNSHIPKMYKYYYGNSSLQKETFDFPLHPWHITHSHRSIEQIFLSN